MERCYRDGELVMDPPPRTAAGLAAYPPREVYDDFTIGGVDLLTEFAGNIDAIFMDPPWGGIDYGTMGKNGYDLARDMKIKGCERGCIGFPPRGRGGRCETAQDCRCGDGVEVCGVRFAEECEQTELGRGGGGGGLRGECQARGALPQREVEDGDGVLWAGL